jgi:hypothetical protein
VLDDRMSEELSSLGYSRWIGVQSKPKSKLIGLWRYLLAWVFGRLLSRLWVPKAESIASVIGGIVGFGIYWAWQRLPQISLVPLQLNTGIGPAAHASQP